MGRRLWVFVWCVVSAASSQAGLIVGGQGDTVAPGGTATVSFSVRKDPSAPGTGVNLHGFRSTLALAAVPGTLQFINPPTDSHRTDSNYVFAGTILPPVSLITWNDQFSITIGDFASTSSPSSPPLPPPPPLPTNVLVSGEKLLFTAAVAVGSSTAPGTYTVSMLAPQSGTGIPGFPFVDSFVAVDGFGPNFLPTYSDVPVDISQAIATITVTSTSTGGVIPEPTSAAIWVLPLGLVMFRRRRR